MYLLDTDFCIDWLRKKTYARTALARVLPGQVAVSAVTVGELLVGAYGAQQPEREAEKVEAFLKPIQVLAYTGAEAVRFARITASLRQEGQLIGVPDAMIAATAQTNRRAVVTRNLRHFGKVKQLRVENWETHPPKRRPAH